MSNKQETIADIIAEMRQESDDCHDIERAWIYDRYADRIEAAAKREEEGRRRGMKIGFSHHYPKLHGQTSAKLLAVLPIRIDKNTPQELLEYDTKFDGGYFPLKTGEYIQLVFVGNLRIPFCTIRSAYPPSKVEYYANAIGKEFEICFKTEEKEGGEGWQKKM